MVSEIRERVLNLERDISVQDRIDTDDDKIRVVSTYKADDNIVDVIRKSEENFKQTPSFRNRVGKLFTFVKKVGPNIKCHVNNLKHQALGNKKRGVVKCNELHLFYCRQQSENSPCQW